MTDEPQAASTDAGVRRRRLTSCLIFVATGIVPWLLWRLFWGPDAGNVPDDEDGPGLGPNAWPRKQMRHWSTGLFVLAPCFVFLVPVSALAGTETRPSRYATAAILATMGFALRMRPASARAAFAQLGGSALVSIALAMAPFVRAPWIAGLWVVIFVHVAVALPIGKAWRRVFPRDPEREESASDVIESIATAFVLALLVREFAFEAFKIPTGSMEPTIMGEGHGRKIGDHLIAAKGPLYFNEPKRWSIVVFKYPLFRPTNYIKRLVGLPGEKLENREGDIYIDGKIVSKPEEVQDTLWFPMLPQAESGEWPGGVGASFTADSPGQWEFTESGAKGTGPADKTAWIVHGSGIGDVKMTFDVDASKLGTGSVRVRLDGGGRRVELEAKRDEMWLTGPGIQRTKLDVEPLGDGTSRLSFAVADRVVRVWRGGRLKARIETADEPNSEGRASQAWIGVENGGAAFSDLKLEHDLQYDTQGAGTWQIPGDSYFMMGDNTRNSKDSRLWSGRVFRTNDGHEYVADEQIRLDGDVSGPNVRETPEAFEFYDSYGAFRHLAKSDLAGGTWKLEKQPFVKRSDLVGRAFLIFLPVPRILP